MTLALTPFALGEPRPNPGAEEEFAGMSKGTSWALDCELPGKPERGWKQECMRRVAWNQGSKGEPWIAINPTNHKHIVVGMKDMDPAYSGGCAWTTLSITFDGGKTWERHGPLGHPSSRPLDSPAYGYQCATDPMFRFSDNGVLHLALDVYSLGKSFDSRFDVGEKQLLLTSFDGGRSWPQVLELFPLSPAETQDRPWIAISPTTGTIVVSFIDVNGSTCYIATSRDGGKTQAEAHRIRSVSQLSRGCMTLAVSPSGVFTAQLQGELPDPRLSTPDESVAHFVTSYDDGRTWTAPRPGFVFEPNPNPFEEGGHRPGWSFMLAYDTQDERLHAFYEDRSKGHGDLLYRFSDDHGTTWSPARRVDDDATNHHRFVGQVLVSDDGAIHTVFLDKRHDPNNRLIDTYYAVSEDRGETWTNARVSTTSYDGNRGRHQNGEPWLADYIGLAARGNEVWAAVPDASSTDLATIAVARFVRDEGRN